ncbi:hypothetical protein FRC09_010053 [Ceratobasidium sp. 395]|nr:hypothetical protein FRC09_010053 [Ceratobasidium sp. 395]
MLTPKQSILLASALALSDVTSALYTVQITKDLQSVVSLKNMTTKDRARMKSFGATRSLLGVVPVVNEDVSYIAPVKVGNQTFRLVVDTGSSNTWVGAGTPYTPGPTATKDGRPVAVKYGSGSFSGEQYTDTVIVGNMTAKNQSISVASWSYGFEGTDGILGVGPVALTKGTITDSENTTIPTIMETLTRQHVIERNVLGAYFQPILSANATEANGELSFGGPDPTRYTGQITYAKITSDPLYGDYWGIDVAKVSYGSTVLAQAVPAIVDTGTTLTYLPSSAFRSFLTVAEGGIDRWSGLPTFSSKPTQNITLVIANRSFTLTPEQYLVPPARYSIFGLNSVQWYAWFADGGGAGGVNFIIGQKTLEQLYSVYDVTNKRLGLAYARPKPGRSQSHSQPGSGSGSQDPISAPSASTSSASRTIMGSQLLGLGVTFVLCFVYVA